MKYIAIICSIAVCTIVYDFFTTPAVVEIYTNQDTYYCNFRNLHVTDELGLVDMRFDSPREMREWVSKTTARDVRAIDEDPEYQEWIITNKCTVIVGQDEVRLNLGGEEIVMPYQESDPDSGKYYYFVD